MIVTAALHSVPSKGDLLVKIRVVALCCALALVTAACGSRLSDDQLAAGGGTGSASATTAPTGSGTTAGTTPSGVAKIGTLPVPCGKGTSAPKAPPTGTEGVTATTIKIAVISDRAGQIKVPTASIEESMQAFVDWCNGFGGINGRKLELTKIDSKLFSQLEATKEACNAGVFAIVGSGSVTDNQGAQAMLDCGLIEVPAYTATAAKSLSDNMVQPLPNPTNQYNVGPALYVKKLHPDAIKKAAILAGGIDTATVQAKRIREAYESVGFKFIYDKTTQVIQQNYSAEAKAMKDAGVEYVNFVNSTPEAVKLLRDMNTQGFHPQVIDFGQQYYDPEILTAGKGAEGLQVLLNTVPFEEAKDSPALAEYLDAYAKVGSKIQPTSLGVQSFSAGLLFATAVKAKGDDLTRDSVLKQLHTYKTWDGGGMHLLGHPGTNAVSTCFMYSEVENGKFVRLFPKKPASFACDPAWGIDLHGDYGKGATLKGN